MKDFEDVTFIPYNKTLRQLARENRKSPTMAERKMWDEILSRKSLTRYKFLRQKPIDTFIVDFYCSSLQLVIEIDGDIHNEKEEYDDARTKKLQTYNLQVIRYTNNAVLHDIESVSADLINRIKEITEISLNKKNR